MRIDITIRFDTEERQTIQEGISSLRLIEPSAEQMVMVHRATENKSIETSWATDFLEVLATLKMRIQQETDCVADPQWVNAAAKAESKGQVPVVKHPEQAVAMLCDIRKGQLELVDKAIDVMKKAIDNAYSARCQIDLDARYHSTAIDRATKQK